MFDFSHPTDDEFLTESHQFLKICSTECSCPDGWHFMWSAYKASGKRRSIYYQQPMLKQLMQPLVPSVKTVLIAGAADAGILHVLSSIFDKSVHYQAVDICNAPGEEMRHYAAQNDLSLEFKQVPLQDYVPDQVFDLIFISNTLIYLQPDQAKQTLRQLQSGMHANSSVVCGMRYVQEGDVDTPERKTELMREFHHMVANTFAQRPDLTALLEPYVTPFFDTVAAMKRYPYTPQMFLEIVEEMGLMSIANFRDDMTPAVVLNTFAKGFNILSDVHLLKIK